MMSESGAEKLADLQRRLAEAEERNLNAVDAMRGAEVRVAQTKRDFEGIFHRLDAREKELRRLKKFLGFELETPLDTVLAGIVERSQGGRRGRTAVSGNG